MAVGLNKAVANLHFIKGANSINGLPGFLQGYFGQVVAVPRKVGQATVLNGATSVDVADTAILATDLVFVTFQDQGTNNVIVTLVQITAASKFTITVNTDPGAGGCIFNYMVMRLVSS